MVDPDNYWYRDQLAAEFAKSRLKNPNCQHVLNPKDWATAMYALADAMIAEGNKRRRPGSYDPT